MGIDGARSSDDASRTAGAHDFVGGTVTSDGAALGFVSAEVDTGPPPAKWYSKALIGPGTDPRSYVTLLEPGLPKVEGWRMQDHFACIDPDGAVPIRREMPGKEIALPVSRSTTSRTSRRTS
jgi:hypothetical protein